MSPTAPPASGGSRRWLIVAALFAINYGMATPLAAYGVFLPIMAETFGWTRGAVSGALSVNLLIGGLAGFLLGSLADRYGPRIILVVTAVLTGAGFALVSLVSELGELYVLIGLIGGVGMSSFYLLSATTIARWFAERRGLALALVLVGFNLGYISAGPLAAWLIARAGWAMAYALIGGGSGAIAALAALSVRLPRPSESRAARRGIAKASGLDVGAPDSARGTTLAEALADPRQWALNLSWFLQGGVALMISVHVVPFARDHGRGLAAASLALTAYGLGAVSGRIASGAVSDRFGAVSTIRAGYVIQALGLTALVLWPSPAVGFAALVAFGVGFAAADTMVARVIPDVFGMKAIGAIMGVLALGWRFGAALGPTAAGLVHDVTGSYALAFALAPVGVLVSWGFFAFATSRRGGLA